MDVRAVVGFNIQRLRRERGYSQEELSFRSGCTRAYLSGIEAGRRNATLLTLEKLARALEVEIAELFLKRAKQGRGQKSPVSVGGRASAGRRNKG